MKASGSLLLALLLPAVALSQSKNSGTVSADNPLLDAVRNAPDPSSAIEAYARASAGGTIAPVQLQRTYLQHMLDHGAPELADAQAHDLIRRGAGDATVWGVAAYDDAARGNIHDAVRNLELGLIQRPNDPFLLRTAGQIVAWYDTQTDRSSLSKEDVAEIEWLRTEGKSRQEFADAYSLAVEARQPRPREATATIPAPTTQGSSTGGNSAANYGSGSGYGNSGSSSGTSYSPYSYYYPYYGYSYKSGASALALRDRDFHQDRPGPGFGPRNPPVHPGDAGNRGPGVDRGGGPPHFGPAQMPPRPPLPPSPPPGPPHP